MKWCPPILERMLLQSFLMPSGCWEWRGGKKLGYGALRVRGRMMSIHRLSYEFFKGAIPRGLAIDHLCCNKSCWNPTHLEAVTLRENTIRWATTRTHCKNGHELTPENIYRYTRYGKPQLTCFTCVQGQWQRAREKSEARA